MMNKLRIISFILLFILLYSCNSDDSSINVESKVINLVIESTHTFKEGDAIGLFVERRENKNTQSTVGTSNYKTNIKWIYHEDGSWVPDGSDNMIYTSADGMPLDIYAYYPYSSQICTSAISVSSVSGIMTGSALNVDNSNEIKLTLNNKTSLVKIIIPDADILSSLQVTMKDIYSRGIIYPAKLGTEEDYSVSTVKSDLELTFENGYYMVYLPEQTLEKNKHLLNIKDGNSTINYNIPEQLLVVKGKKSEVIVNNATYTLADLPNTFMIEPGSEIFISVQKAYKMWKTNSLLVSTSPDLSGEISAEISWQENLQEVIESVDVTGVKEDAVIHVKTKSEKVGNAIIAVRIGETIRWSWQLWVSDYNPVSKENGTTYDFNGFTFMDRNLGATVNPETGGDRTFGLHYQWGRKDPFQTRGNVETTSVTDEMTTNLVNSIIFPDTFITSSSSPNDWYTKTGNLGLDRWNSEQNTKTPFDPCPKGWRVPETNLDNESPWYGLALPEDENKWGSGWYFDETPDIGYYPAAGQRTAAGTTTYAGSAGFYHTAKSNSSMRLDFTSVSLSFGGGKAAGRSVRCVKEY